MPTDSLRGRVTQRDLRQGDRYYGVYSATGVKIFATRSKTQAEEIAAKDPERRTITEHMKRRP